MPVQHTNNFLYIPLSTHSPPGLFHPPNTPILFFLNGPLQTNDLFSLQQSGSHAHRPNHSTQPIFHNVHLSFGYGSKSLGLPGILAERHFIQGCLKFITSSYFFWTFCFSTPQFHIPLTIFLYLCTLFPSLKHHAYYMNQFSF